MMPITASMTARISRILLPDGSLNAFVRSWPASTKNTTMSTRCMTAPARLFTPTAATLAGPSDPAFCRNRAFSAIPPTLAGDTRLMNDDANWATTVGQNGTWPGTPPMSAIALAT
jgi:hypothetical protein